jgi:hypothetical protein
VSLLGADTPKRMFEVPLTKDVQLEVCEKVAEKKFSVKSKEK